MMAAGRRVTFLHVVGCFEAVWPACRPEARLSVPGGVNLIVITIFRF